MTVHAPVYLDNSATTPLDPEVLEAMMPFLTDSFGNASSQHHHGYIAQKAVQRARESLAELINCEPVEIYWTSGATESNNIALWGVAKTFSRDQFQALCSPVEHKSVLEVMKALQHDGFALNLLPTNAYGQVTAELVEAHINKFTRLFSALAGNNEIGSLNPIRELADLARDKDFLFHCDMAQTLGKIPIDLREVPIDLATFSAHKIYGPKGVGALFVRRPLRLGHFLFGGAQEGGLRPGTINVAGVVGFGKACEIAKKKLALEKTRLCDLQQQTFLKLQAITPGLQLNGHPVDRIPGHLNISHPQLDPDLCALDLAQFSLSRGSACSHGEASYVLLALGLSKELANQSLRIAFGRYNTVEHSNLLVQAWSRMAQKLPPFRSTASML